MLTDEAADPMDRHVHVFRVGLHLDDDAFDETANNLFAIDDAGGRRLPQGREIFGQRLNAVYLGVRQFERFLLHEAIVLLLSLPEMPHTVVAARLRARIANLHTDSTAATKHQTAQENGPLPRSAGRIPPRTVLTQPFLIPLVPLPGDVRWHAIGQHGFPLLD